MGVRKYRSIEEMPGPPPRVPLDPENLRLAFALMDLARRLGLPGDVPGVRRFRSYPDLVVDRERRDAARIREAREAGGRRPR